MKIDNSAYYRRQSRSVIKRVLFALIILTVAAIAYLIIDRNIAIRTMASLVESDYSEKTISFIQDSTVQHAGYALNERQEETLGTYEYVTPLGFSIVSQSEKWTGEKLVEIYDELLKNKHGDEIMYVSKIMIYPGPSDLGLTDSNVAGTHSQQQSVYRVFFDIPSILPQTMEYSFKSNLSVIELYNMDEYDDISEAAQTISHEYGHHYTMFYFLQSDDEAKLSEYYLLRGFGSYDKPVFFSTVDEYYANHEWSIYEIAAEDYMQLMGSDTGKRTEEYLDVYDLATEYAGDTYSRKYDDGILNVYPQENIYIPLADEIGGLREYFYSFIGLSDDLTPLEPAVFNLSMEKKTSPGSSYYEITWDRTSTDPNALYTLVCYNMDGTLHIAIRTVAGNETPVARVGKYMVYTDGHYEGFESDVTKEDRYFRLYLILPDGRMQSSELFYADF